MLFQPCHQAVIIMEHVSFSSSSLLALSAVTVGFYSTVQYEIHVARDDLKCFETVICFSRVLLCHHHRFTVLSPRSYEERVETLQLQPV